MGIMILFEGGRRRGYVVYLTGCGILQGEEDLTMTLCTCHRDERCRCYELGDDEVGCPECGSIELHCECGCTCDEAADYEVDQARQEGQV